MFKGLQKTSAKSGDVKKIEDKVSSDFVTHNMPEPNRFSGQTFADPASRNSKKTGNLKNVESHHKVGLVIIGAGLILIGSLLYFGYVYLIKPYVKPNEPNVVSQPAKSNVATTSQPDEPIVPVIIATSSPIVSTSTTVEATSTSLMPEETPVVIPPMVVSTVDSDADGLTDAEEKIIGTDPNKADTDNDGYLDLAELKSGYDPLVPGKKSSETSTMLNYQIDPKTSVIYPATWDVTKSDTNQAVVFADSDKAFIQVTYQANPGKTTPQAWLAGQPTNLKIGEMVNGQNWQGFYSADGLSAYIFNKDLSKIYSFSCSPLTSDTGSVTVFHLMIKTLTIK